MPPLKIFISSTSNDLKEYRQKAIEIIERYRCQPLAMEYFGAQPKEPKKVCGKEVEECDIFIGIYAHRYGFIPEGEKKSITQLEYELAKNLDKDCLCFIVAKNHPWNPEFIEFERLKNLTDFLKIIKKEKTVEFFSTPADFESKLSASLGKLLVDKQEQAKSETPIAKSQSLIPIAPTPFIAHPYPLPQNFTGREAEKSMLFNWFYNANEPLLVLEAIGGMGKTALSWVWLKEILEKSDELAGVIWWSFYDAPFETFLPALYHYLTSQEVKIDRDAYYFGGELSQLFSILYRNNFLLVLDGFERALRGYASMTAMYIQENGFVSGVRSLYGSQAAHKGAALPNDDDWDRRQREPVHPLAPKFLRALATGSTKTLITTRLFPTPLEGIAGVKREMLLGLSHTDAVRFLRREGVSGSRAELEQAGEIYGFHPLMLKQLSTAIKRTRLKDISAAFQQNIIDQQEPQKILQKSFSLLHDEERKVATTVSVLRSAFSFDTALALFPKIEEDTLWQILCGLQQLGFLFYDDETKQFDFHPILRSFLYDNLTAKEKVHQQAVSYFEALPKAEKVVKLEDLAPVIELYHHLIGAGKFDEAYKLQRDRLAEQIYYQLSNYNLYIELLKELFPGGENQPPHLKKEGDQAWTLNSLAISYSLYGQPAKAVPLFLRQIKIRNIEGVKKSVAIGLGNVAGFGQLPIGQLSATAVHLWKSIALYQEIKDEFNEAIGHQQLGRVLAFQGRMKNPPGRIGNLPQVLLAEDELAKAMNVFVKCKTNFTSVCSAYRSLSILLRARVGQIGNLSNIGQIANLPYIGAHQALEFAEKWTKTNYPLPRDFIRAYWLLGESLIQWKNQNAKIKMKPLEIHFYDEPFQTITGTEVVQPGNELTVAERCLTEALRRCRKVNLMEMEADILLAWGRLVWVTGKLGNKVIGKMGEVEEFLKEAKEIADRAGYRLQLADIHLFCGEVLLEIPGEKLLGLMVREHLQLAKEYAKDVSTFEDLYHSQDSHFYDGIPEYEMLKRGMTEQERIQNGYWVAYQIAEALEKRLK